MLKLFSNKPFIFHIRTSLENLYEGNSINNKIFHINDISSKFFAKMQINFISSISTDLIFISNFEKISFMNLGGTKKGNIVNNIVEKIKPKSKYINLKSENRFKVAVIENFRWSRGTDRVVEIVQKLHKLNEKRIVFVVAGDMRIPKHLHKKFLKYSNLKDYICSLGLSNYFIFLGHVKNPEEVIFECDILSSLSRRAGPWGRSVLESLQLAKPVISAGDNKGLVINNKNGIHINKYQPADIIRAIIFLLENKKEYANLSRGAKNFIATYFDSKENSKKIFSVWKKAIKHK